MSVRVKKRHQKQTQTYRSLPQPSPAPLCTRHVSASWGRDWTTNFKDILGNTAGNPNFTTDLKDPKS